MTPTAEEQIRFLNNLQRLLTEGGFTSTYKFALLLALSDLCVELDPSPGTTAALMMRISQLNLSSTTGTIRFRTQVLR